MFLRCSKRRKDGKEHLYWSIVENRRLGGGQIVQRHVLYLGELNGRQEASWRKTVDLFGEDEEAPQQAALFPDEHAPDEAVVAEQPVVRIKLKEMSLRRPRQWGACWLGCELWQLLGLDIFWRERLPASREGTRWDLVLQNLARRTLATTRRLSNAASQLSLRMHPRTKRQIRQIALIGALPVAICCFALSYIVWLPDLSGREALVCKWGAPDASRHISVVQVWNNADFYSTVALLEDRDGLVSWVIDGDDFKRWRGSLVATSDLTVDLTLGGERFGTFYPAERRLQRTDGINLPLWTKSAEEWALVKKKFAMRK